MNVSLPRLVLLTLALIVLPLGPIAGRAAAGEAAQPGGLLVYHQITDLSGGSGSVGYPVLSADGTTAVFSDAPGSGDPATPNRILVVDVEGGEPAEVDSYVPLCYCGALVDISADGETVVSTDAVQVRIVSGGAARELIVLASNEITAVKLSGDGQTVFFLVRRTTGTTDGTTIERGVWAIGADGDDLRLIVGAEAVSAAVEAPYDPNACCFHGDGGPLDVSADGSRLVVGAYAGAGEHVFSVEVDGGEPTALVGPATWVKGVAISADGGTVAYDVILPERQDGLNEVGVVDTGGGETRQMLVGSNSGFDDPLSLSEDGSVLLVVPNGFLIDTASGELRSLAVPTPGSDSHTNVLTDGLARATLDAEKGRRVLYAIRTIRCADCANPHEQLAVLDLDPAEAGEAPTIDEAALDPTEIPLDGQSAATVSAAIDADGTLRSVGVIALLDGRSDVNVVPRLPLLDDGQNGDARANDGVYGAEIVYYPVQGRADDDTGPRLILIQAEVEAADGLHHATALDVGTVTVVE